MIIRRSTKQGLQSSFLTTVILSLSLLFSKSPTEWLIFGIIFIAVVSFLIEKYKVISADTDNTETSEILLNRVLETSDYLAVQLDIPIRSHISWMDDDQKLRIKYSYNMGSDRDINIALESKEGCMGTTWHLASDGSDFGTFCDLSLAQQAGGPQWNMPDEEQRKVKDDLKWIYTFPVFSRSEGSLDLIALLTFDSTKEIPYNSDLSTAEMILLITFGKSLAFILADILDSTKNIKNIVIVDS